MEKYKCWDCKKEIKGVELDDKIKNKCPKTLDGFFLIICDNCMDNEDY